MIDYDEILRENVRNIPQKTPFSILPGDEFEVITHLAVQYRNMVFI